MIMCKQILILMFFLVFQTICCLGQETINGEWENRDNTDYTETLYIKDDSFSIFRIPHGKNAFRHTYYGSSIDGKVSTVSDNQGNRYNVLISDKNNKHYVVLSTKNGILLKKIRFLSPQERSHQAKIGFFLSAITEDMSFFVNSLSNTVVSKGDILFSKSNRDYCKSVIDQGDMIYEIFYKDHLLSHALALHTALISLDMTYEVRNIGLQTLDNIGFNMGWFIGKANDVVIEGAIERAPAKTHKTITSAQKFHKVNKYFQRAIGLIKQIKLLRNTLVDFDRVIRLEDELRQVLRDIKKERPLIDQFFYFAYDISEDYKKLNCFLYSHKMVKFYPRWYGLKTYDVCLDPQLYNPWKNANRKLAKDFNFIYYCNS